MKTKNTTNNTTTAKNHFNHLKTMFYQAPLSEPKFNELVTLAERFDKKMANYLKENRSMFV